MCRALDPVVPKRFLHCIAMGKPPKHSRRNLEWGEVYFLRVLRLIIMGLEAWWQGFQSSLKDRLGKIKRVLAELAAYQASPWRST